ncbi:MAG: ketoacyl-ACP synthase III [Rickettsiales bacterium]|nr:ketoacyl-ACP synthase III [Rickettsiales bacterium]
MIFSSKITATGSYLPKNIVTNHDLAKKVDTSNEWIIERTGIKQRHISEENELTSDISVKAAQNLFNSCDKNPEDIELIILATTTPDLTFPATATTIQAKLGAKNAFAFDIQAVCSGFVFALNTAHNFIKSGQVKNALVIGADTLSKIVDWNDRNTCVLFGDGAGAVLLEQCEEGKGIIATDLHSDGRLNGILKTSGGPSLNQISGKIEMQGKEVFKHAVTKMSSSVESALKKANLTKEDINLLVPHQANIRILEGVAKKLKLRDDQVVITVPKHANTSAASIPLALDETFQKNKIKENDIVVLEALGGGLTWGSIVVRW